MKEQQTCGKGLAENSALPAKLGELTDAFAEILEAHREALDPTDENHPEKMAAPRVREALQEFVELEQELAALLQKRLEADRKMLREMSGAG
jgi:hypothetical protein